MREWRVNEKGLLARSKDIVYVKNWKKKKKKNQKLVNEFNKLVENLLICASLLSFMCECVIIFLYSLPHRSISAGLATCIPQRLIFFLYQILNFLTKNSVFLTSLVESWKPISLLVFYLTLFSRLTHFSLTHFHYITSFFGHSR